MDDCEWEQDLSAGKTLQRGFKLTSASGGSANSHFYLLFYVSWRRFGKDFSESVKRRQSSSLLPPTRNWRWSVARSGECTPKSITYLYHNHGSCSLSLRMVMRAGQQHVVKSSNPGSATDASFCRERKTCWFILTITWLFFFLQICIEFIFPLSFKRLLITFTLLC